MTDNQSQNTTLKGKDNAIYTRQQKGHSIIVHILLCFVIIGFITIPVYTISKNHYWHA